MCIKTVSFVIESLYVCCTEATYKQDQKIPHNAVGYLLQNGIYSIEQLFYSQWMNWMSHFAIFTMSTQQSTLIYIMKMFIEMIVPCTVT